jgi:hypothetical protein
MPTKKILTVKQRRYVDCFDGDIKRSAEKAGISYVYAKELHAKTCYAYVMEYIQNINDNQSSRNIATRQERQEFWTKVLNGTEKFEVVVGSGETQKVVELPAKMADRLKASELLGRSFADFVERKEITGKITLEEKLSEIRR